MMLAWLVWAASAWGGWGVDDLVRVDVPDHPDAVARSATGALLVGPPSDGTPWRRASIPVTDQVDLPFPALEAVDVLGVAEWHRDGVTGQGVRVAVFDAAWFIGESDPREVGEVVTHDCFASATCEVPFDLERPALTGESGSHGWACAEVVRDLAPDAEIHVVRVNSFTALENAVDWAIRDGIDVISMSLSYYNDSFYDGTGPHAALAERLDSAGVLWVTSAGNDADKHWKGEFLDVDMDGRMDGDGDNGLWLYLPAGTATVYLNWDERLSCGKTDLSAQVVDERRYVLGRSDDLQERDGEGCEPHERVRAVVAEEGWYRLEVEVERGSAEGLQVDVLNRGGGIVDGVAASSVVDPAAHPRVFSVGAVRASDYWDGTVEGFSSWGPNHAGVVRPDIAGPDGISTDTYGSVGFFGTSASTPAVAGLVALVMSDDGRPSPREAATRLQGWARTDRPDLQRDPRWGVGKARLPQREPGPAGCGRGPLLLWFLPMFLVRRRRLLHAGRRYRRDLEG